MTGKQLCMGLFIVEPEWDSIGLRLYPNINIGTDIGVDRQFHAGSVHHFRDLIAHGGNLIQRFAKHRYAVCVLRADC